MRRRFGPSLVVLILIAISIGIPLVDSMSYWFISRSNSFEIEISDNEELLNEADEMGWNGTGTTNDPVIIENISYDLDPNNIDSGISLKDISLYVVIQNVTIRSGEYGIICNNVSNLIIKETTMIDCDSGIQINYGTNISIIESNFSSGHIGLNIRETVLSIRGCQFEYLAHGAIFPWGGDLEVSNCTFSNIDGYDYYSPSSEKEIMIDGKALSISHVKKAIVKNNHIYYSDIGIHINGIKTGEVSDNNLQTGKIGIEYYASTSLGAIIRGNEINDFTDGGMLLSADGYHIWKNRLTNCSFGFGNINSDIPFDFGLSDNNTVNGLPIEYRYKGMMIEDNPPERGQYIAVDCEIVSLSNLTLTSVSHGIMVAFSDRIDIWNCTFKEISAIGINIIFGGVFNIFNNTFVDLKNGLNIDCEYHWDTEFSIIDNVFLRNEIGLYFDVGEVFETSDVYRNVFYECLTSIYTWHLAGTNIYMNDIVGSKNYSIRAKYDHGSYFWNNFFYNIRTNFTYINGSYQGIRCDFGKSMNFYNPIIEDYGNYWSDGGHLDLDKNGILDEPHPVGKLESGEQIFDEYPLLHPVESKHILLDFNGSQDSINLTWELPEYHFLGNLTSLIMHRIDAIGQDISLGEVLNGPGFIIDANIGDYSNYTYYLFPTFEDGEGYPSNSVTVLHDSSIPIIEIISPENGSAFRSHKDILIEWKVVNEADYNVRFRIKVNDYDWDEIGTKFSYEFNVLPYGINTIIVEGTDLMGFSSTDEVKVIIDWIGPEIEILSPTNNKIYDEASIYFSWNVWDEFLNVSEVKIRIDSGDWIEVTELNDFHFYNLSVGEHRIDIEAVDSLGNLKEKYLWITIILDNSPVKILKPYEGEMFNTKYIFLVWEIENLEIVDAILLSLDEEEWIPIDHVLSMNISFNTDGFKNIKLKVISLAGIIFMDQVNISIDTSAPFVVHASPLGDNIPIDTRVYISFSEEMDRDSVIILIDTMAGEISWHQNMAIVRNLQPLEYNKDILVEVQGKDLHGNEMHIYSYSFKTTDFGFISGKVIDEEGKPIIGASIQFGNDDRIHTNINGSFSYELHEGDYKIQVSKNGYNNFDHRFNITAGSITDLGDIVLIKNEDSTGVNQQNTLFIIFLVGIALLAVIIASIAVYIAYNNEQRSSNWEE